MDDIQFFQTSRDVPIVRIDPAGVDPLFDMALDVLVKQADRPGHDREEQQSLCPLEERDREQRAVSAMPGF
jgi:hypothetical protein